MSEIIRTDIKVYYTESILNQTNRLVTQTLTQVPNSHEFGNRSFANKVTDYLFLENVNYFIIKSDLPLTVKVGDTSSQPEPLVGTKFFAYEGNPIDVQITNENDEEVNIEYVAVKD